MKIQANTIRPGMVLDHQGKLWTVLKIQLIQPGKGGAFIQVDMRALDSGNKTNERWRTADTVERLSVDERECTYLFQDEHHYTFMDSETFEQIAIDEDTIGDPHVFLQENMPVTIDTIEGKPVAVHLPVSVTLAITEADAVVKGQTASSSYKPAILENGVKIMVPPHIGTGTRVVVNTETREYVERAKD